MHLFAARLYNHPQGIDDDHRKRNGLEGLAFSNPAALGVLAAGHWRLTRLATSFGADMSGRNIHNKLGSSVCRP